MTRIALVDFDMTGFPNLALMKLSAWHKMQGHKVLPLNFIMGADKIYGSCVFPKNAQRERLPWEAEVGGSGFGVETWLPAEVEHIMPDYTLYGTNHSMGFTSRGCSRRCPWCMVPDKEGLIQPWTTIYEFWNRKHSRLWLLDNNLLAALNWKETLQAVIKERVKVDFNQALDIRLVNDEVAHLLTQCRYDTFLRFSFDRIEYEPYVHQGLTALAAYGFPLAKVMIFLLVGFDSTLQEDLERVAIIRSYGASPFVMKYQPVKDINPVVIRSTAELRELARWINQPHGFYKVMSFDEWLKAQEGHATNQGEDGSMMPLDSEEL